MAATTRTPTPWYRKAGFLVAAGFIGLVALGAVIVLIVSLMTPPTTPPDASTPASTSEPADAAASICGLDTYEATSSLDEAPDAEWSVVGVMDAPASEAGPSEIDADGFRSCFAHTAEGSLLFVANYLALTTDPALSGRLNELIAGEPSVSPDSSGGYSEVRLAVAGYRILQYGSEAATIDLAVRIDSQGGALTSMPISVVWADGDWKLSPDSDNLSGIAPIQSLGGYTAWSASDG